MPRFRAAARLTKTGGRRFVLVDAVDEPDARAALRDRGFEPDTLDRVEVGPAVGGEKIIRSPRYASIAIDGIDPGAEGSDPLEAVAARAGGRLAKKPVSTIATGIVVGVVVLAALAGGAWWAIQQLGVGL